MFKEETITKDYQNLVRQLESRIEDLERKLEEKTSKEDVSKEISSRLSAYGESIRSDKGEIVLRKTFNIKGRVGKVKGRSQEDRDGVMAMFYNDKDPKNLNHIFIGSASAEGDYETNTVAIHAKYKDTAEGILNNGIFQVILLKDEDIKTLPDGKTSIEGAVPQISVLSTAHALGMSEKDYGRGEAILITGTNEKGAAQISHMIDGIMTAGILITKDRMDLSAPMITIDKDKLPKSKPSEEEVLWLDGQTLKLS